MSASLSGVFSLQEFADGGAPLVGGQLYTYVAGTTTVKAAYTDAAATVAQTYTADAFGGQYIALNARGELPAPLYLTTGSYDLTLKRADGSTVWTRRAEPTGDLSSEGAITLSLAPLVESQSASAGQTIFTLTTMSYPVGLHSLNVMVDGIKVSDYTETSPTVVTFTTAFLGGENVEFTVGGYTATNNGKTLITHSTTNSADVGTFRVQRSVEYSGGTPGFVNAAIRADTYVDNAGATAFEWAVVGVMHNHATAGENVGGYFQGIKYSTGPTWGATIEVIDNTGANPGTGAISLELDMDANGTDDNNARVCLDIAIRRVGGTGAAMEAGYGIRFQNSFDTSTFLKTAIGFFPGMACGLGIDLSPAVITGAAIKMAQAQAIAFDGLANPTKLASQGLGLDHLAGALLVNRLLTTGGLQVGSVQVVGPRKGGWGTPPGSISRTPIDAAAVTLAQLGAIVNGLITDIHGATSGHGLIGV